MGACATKPQIKGDEGDTPAPEPVEEVVKNAGEMKVEEFVKTAEGVKVEEEDQNKVNQNDEKNIALDEEKQRSLASLLVQKEGIPAVEASTETKEEKPKAEESKAEPTKEATESAPFASAAAQELKKSDEKATENDGKS